MSDGGTARASAFERGGARKAAEGLDHLSGFGNEHSSEALPAPCPRDATRLSARRSGCTRSS
ncbi:hypothetical protein ACR6C2_10590 [Streptomyces sp. INA 01156]